MFWTEPLIYYSAACILTVILEVGLFRVCGYRKPLDLGIVALANVVTNVALNLILELVIAAFDLPWIIVLEIIVIAAEYLIYSRAFGPSRNLFILTFCANLLSFLAGAVVYELF